jgi:hypothetical protein
MFGRNDSDEESCGSEERPQDMTNDHRVSETEEMVERLDEYIKREREPFWFIVFRDEDEQVTQWCLETEKRVDSQESRAPVIVGQGEGMSRQVMMFEYSSRYPEDRDETVFEYVQREKVIPSNQFYKWLSETVESIAAFHREIENLDNINAFSDLSPELPPLYGNLNGYEKQALRFLGETLVEHRDYTKEQAQLIREAVRRYPVEDSVLEEFTGDAFSEEQEDKNADLPGDNEEGDSQA